MAKTKTELAEENKALRADIAIIAERLKNEAVNREWCSVYDDVMNEVNEQTSEPHMQPCRTEVTVQTSGRVTVNFSDLKVDVPVNHDDSDIDDAVRDYLRHEVRILHHYVLDSIDEVVLTESEFS